MEEQEKRDDVSTYCGHCRRTENGSPEELGFIFCPICGNRFHRQCLIFMHGQSVNPVCVPCYNFGNTWVEVVERLGVEFPLNDAFNMAFFLMASREGADGVRKWMNIVMLGKPKVHKTLGLEWDYAGEGWICDMFQDECTVYRDLIAMTESLNQVNKGANRCRHYEELVEDMKARWGFHIPE